MAQAIPLGMEGIVLTSDSRYHVAIAEAVELLKSALEASHFSWARCEEIYRSERLEEDLDAKNKMLELQVWQLGGADDQQAEVAKIFFDAGRRFSLTMEFSQVPEGSIEEKAIRGADAFNKALVCLHVALDLTKLSGASKFRQLEIDAAHAIAYACLTWHEIVSRLAGGGSSADEIVRAAGAYYELEGRFMLKRGQKEEAADAFSTAAHQYTRAGRAVLAARLSEEESQLRRKSEDREGAVEALQKQAGYLHDAGAIAKEPDEKARHAWNSAAADIRAGRLLAEDELRKVEAANLIVKGAKLAASRPADERGIIIYWKDNPANADTLVLDSLRLAEDLYEEAGNFRDADFAHRLRRQYARTLYPRHSPVFLFSLLLDVVWGYGTKPGRLVITCVFVIVGFAAVYAALAPPHPTAAALLAQMQALMAVGRNAVVTSLEAFAQEWLLKWKDILGIGLGVPAVPAVRYVSWVEAGLGFALLSMAAFILVRWFRRNFIPH